VTEPKYTDSELVEFAKAFLQQHTQIWNKERQPIFPIAPLGKLTKEQKEEAEQLHRTGATPGIYTDLDMQVQKQFGRTAGPQNLQMTPAIANAVDKFKQTSQTPLDKAALYKTVNTELTQQNFHQNILRTIRDKIFQNPIARTDPNYQNAYLENVIRMNKEPNIYQNKGTPGTDVQNYAPGQREASYHQTSVQEQYNKNFENEVHTNVVSNTSLQRIANLRLTYALVQKNYDQVIKEIGLFHLYLEKSVEHQGNLFEFAASAIGKSWGQKLLDEQHSLVNAHPDLFSLKQTPNETLEQLKKLADSLHDQANSIISDINNPRENSIPNQNIENAMNKELYKLDPATYRHDIQQYLTTNSVNLNELQKDLLQKEIDAPSVTARSFYQLSQRLDQTLSPEQDRGMFNSMFDINMHLNNEVRNHGTALPFQATLHGLFHDAINRGDVYHAQGFLNAIWHPTTGEEHISSKDHLESLIDTRKYYDSSNPLVHNQIYQNEFTKSLPEDIFNEYTTVKNTLAAFTARFQQYGVAPDQSETTAYATQYLNFKRKIAALTAQNPSNLLYKAINDHSEQLYNPHGLYRLFHDPLGYNSKLVEDTARLAQGPNLLSFDTQVENTPQQQVDSEEMKEAESGDNEIVNDQKVGAGRDKHHYHKYIKALQHHSPHQTAKEHDAHFEKNAHHMHHNQSMMGGVAHNIAALYTHHKPHDHVIHMLNKLSHLDTVSNNKHIEAKGCGFCGGILQLHGHSKNKADITCASCLEKNGMTSKRFNPLQVKPVPLESSPHEEHRKLAEDHKHNTLLASIQRYGGSEKNLFERFEETYSGSKKFVSQWKKDYVVDRPFASNDLDKLVFATGYFLYNEAATNDEFLDNLNALAIKYLEKVDKDDSLKKVALTHKFMTFDELKKLIESRPGVLLTLIYDLDH
jgi:hypothetical protein